MGCGSSKSQDEGAANTTQTSQSVSRQNSTHPNADGSSPTDVANKREQRYRAPHVAFQLLQPPPDKKHHKSHQPSARKMHSAVAIGEHSIIIFGGISRKEAFNDTGDLEASITVSHLKINHQTFRVGLAHLDWHLINPAGDVPSHRASHQALTHEGTMYVFGTNDKKDSDVYAFNAAFCQWRKIDTSAGVKLPKKKKGEAPPLMNDIDQNHPRPVAGCSIAAISNVLIAFGGESDMGLSNALHVLHLEERRWRAIPHQGPLFDKFKKPLSMMDGLRGLLPRRDHSAVIIEMTMYVFGGFGADSDALPFIQFDASAQDWSLVKHGGQVPKTRGAHSATAYENWMIVFGGQRHREFLNDLHVFNTHSHMWHAIAIPVPRGKTTSSNTNQQQTFVVPDPRGFAASCRIHEDWFIHGGGDDHAIFADFLRVNVREICRAADNSMPVSADDALTEDEKRANVAKAKRIGGAWDALTLQQQGWDDEFM